MKYHKDQLKLKVGDFVANSFDFVYQVIGIWQGVGSVGYILDFDPQYEDWFCNKRQFEKVTK